MEFKFPFTMCISGPTRSGKTELCKRLVKHAQQLISPPPERIMWCYGEWQDGYKDIVPYCEMHQGLPDLQELKNDKTRKLVITDDLMLTVDEKALNTLFCQGSHHWNMAVIHIVQNMFYKTMRNCRINSHYLLLLKNPSDKLQVSTLAKQLFPCNHQHFLEAFHDACHEPFGYLLVDLEPTTIDDLRLRSHIFPDELCCVYKSIKAQRY